jgi:hypothetical protein
MEWLTQSLPDVRDSEKPRMGSNDLAPCLRSALLSTRLPPRFIYFFFASGALTHTYEHSPRLDAPRKMKKKARSTSLARMDYFVAAAQQMSSNFAMSERKIGARRQSQTHISLSLTRSSLPPRCIIICIEFCLSRCSRAPEILRADAWAIFVGIFLLL